MPARFRDIIRLVESPAYRCVVEKPSGSSHWKIRTPTGDTYPVPAGNGLKTEVDDKYIKGLCKLLGVDPKKFKSEL